MQVLNLESIRIKLASPDDILRWSYGEITKPETINYRTQRAEKDGLFCEKIFGPEKDYECYCGKYKRIRYKGIVCDRCGVEVTKSQVRRERMGHIKLACPVSHIWFLRGIPSRIGMVIDIPMKDLEKVIYFAAYIITDVNEEVKKGILEEINKEHRLKVKTNPAQRIDFDQLKDEVKEEVVNLSLHRVLSEVEYYELSLKYGEAFEAETGSEALRKIFTKIDLKKEVKKIEEELTKGVATKRKKLLQRLRIFQMMILAEIRPEWMFLQYIPVLPPDLRPMVQLDGGRYASSDLNDLYRRVINRNNRLNYLLEIKAPEVIVRNEKRMLQEAVDALIDNTMRKGILTTATTGGKRLLKSLADMLKGKQGRFRQNLLGKRVDYSGRSVIVVGPELKLDQCGLPKKMALELFKPFVIKEILEKELSYNVRGASKLIEQETDEVWAILEEVVKGKYVLLNRAPTLHRLGIQAFHPVLVEGDAIRLHPFVCKAFNADFDGDQMAVHLPLGEEAQREAKELMLSSLNLLKPATGGPIVIPSQEIILGIYWLTKIKPGEKGEGKIFSNHSELEMAFEMGKVDIRAEVKVRLNGEIIETSLGRLIFNQALPENYHFVNKLIGSGEVKTLIADIIGKYNQEEIEQFLDKIKSLGFKYATFSGISWGMDDLMVPEEKKGIMEKAEKEVANIENYFKKGLLSAEEKSSKVIETWAGVKSEIEKLIPKTLPEFGPVYSIIDSGARGSWSQPAQMAGMKGLVINPSGQIIELPIKSSYKEGFNALEYFISTHGARKGTADTALRTSTAGYLTRRLVDVAQDIVVREKDCKDKKGWEVSKEESEESGQNFIFKVVGRFTSEEVKSGQKIIVKAGEIIGWDEAKKITDDPKIEKVSIRSPLSCQAIRGICQTCYGWDLGLNKVINLGSAVGVIAAQAIGEPGTQLTMRTFHTGGVAGVSDITTGLPRAEEVFEARTPKGQAEIAKADGQVLEITSNNIVKVKTDKLVVNYHAPSQAVIMVKKGDKIKKGQQISEGNFDLKEYYKLHSEEETQRYIVQEIQKIYASQGAGIHDKHIEIIAKKMFSRIKIKEAGDSLFIPGEIIEKAVVLEENQRLKKQKKELIKFSPVILGITRVSLSTDSFLSAASFQETSRVLIKACLEGKEDRLLGPKENIIIGKIVPIGTGFKK